MELLRKHGHRHAFRISSRTFVVSNPRIYCMSAFTMKIGEDYDAGGCLPDITPISGFDLWR